MSYNHLFMIHFLAPILLSLSFAIAPLGRDVGELQEKWEFPSDHLPIGISLGDLHIVSWNVLDAAYMRWVTELNSQGLSRSLIAREHVPVGDGGLTLRDLHVIERICALTEHPTHPRDVIALQECGEPFLASLKDHLNASFDVVAHHGQAIVYNKKRFQLVEAKEVSGVFVKEEERSFQELTLEESEGGATLRLINAHLPGDPSKPARFEFGAYLAKTHDPKVTTLAMGDMNFNELEMEQALSKAFVGKLPFSIYSPYCTNISPYTFRSKAIDHFFLYAQPPRAVAVNTPSEIMPDLAAIAALL